MTRVEAMTALYRDGQTLEQIGAVYGVTRERVRQLLSGAGVTRMQGGQAVRAAKLKAVNNARRDARFLRTKGCTFAQYCELRALGKPTRAYSMQKKNADRRGIAWEFTLWQWWTLWQQSGRWNQRGRGNGYMMCRKGDVGPYSADNVMIARGIENSSTANKKSDLPMGVRKNKKFRGYSASRQVNGKVIRLGSFATPEEAHAAYLAADPMREAA